MDTMEDEDENDVGGFIQNGWNRHNNAAIKYGPQLLLPPSGVLPVALCWWTLRNGYHGR